jgi:hypothetical protein
MSGERGALIWPMFVEIEQIDTDATATTDPDGAGPLTSGYDDVFEEPVLVPATEESPGVPQVGSLRGAEATIYVAPIRLEAQIEVDDYNILRQFASGDVPNFELRCVIHYAELELLGLMGPDGSTTLRKNDRLRRIIDQDGVLLLEVPYPPGLYLRHPQDRSFGLSGGTRNLFVAHFGPRDQGVPG